jgi:hypothetical protein
MGDHDEITDRTTGHSAFYDALLELADIHHKKSHDYGLNDDDDGLEEFIAADPLFNFRGSVLWGVDPWVGAMIRAQDKVSRLQTLAAGHDLENENARDTFLDLASYALIAMILWEEAQADELVEPEEEDTDD